MKLIDVAEILEIVALEGTTSNKHMKIIVCEYSFT